MHLDLIVALDTTFIVGAAVAQVAPPNSDPSYNPAANSAVSNPAAAVPHQLHHKVIPIRMGSTELRQAP